MVTLKNETMGHAETLGECAPTGDDGRDTPSLHLHFAQPLYITQQRTVMIPVKPAPQGRPVGPPDVFPSGKGAFSRITPRPFKDRSRPSVRTSSVPTKRYDDLSIPRKKMNYDSSFAMNYDSLRGSSEPDQGKDPPGGRPEVRGFDLTNIMIDYVERTHGEYERASQDTPDPKI